MPAEQALCGTAHACETRVPLTARPTHRVMDCGGKAGAATPLSPATAAHKLKTISVSSVARAVKE